MPVKRYNTSFALTFNKVEGNQKLCQIDEILFESRVKNAMEMPKEITKENYLHPSSDSIVYWLSISTAR